MPEMEALYLKLPTSLQQMACSLEGWRIKRSRYNTEFFEILSAAEERTTWAQGKLEEFRNARFREFIRHCADTVPYYRRRFAELGIEAEEIRTFEAMARLPVLSKDEVRENLESLVSDAVPTRERVTAHTSGTTGAGLRFQTTHRALQEQWATWWRYRRWHGINLDTWCGFFGGRSVVPAAQKGPPLWRYNYPMRQVLFSGYHMSPENLPLYVAELRRAKPPWLNGYPSLVALLAAHMLEYRKDLGYRVRWITVASENLLPQQAELITRAFGVRPIQHYGMTEGAANFSECEKGKLHVDEDFAAVEFVRDPDRKSCRVIGTNLSNRAFPLLRYELRDLATLSVEVCSCGRAGRVISSIDGRLEDYIVLRNGTRIGRMDHVFKDLVRIKEAQIYQRVPGEMTIRVVPGTGYSNHDEAALLCELRKRVGDGSEIRIDYVNQLPRSLNGKLRFVISEAQRLQDLNLLAGTGAQSDQVCL